MNREHSSIVSPVKKDDAYWSALFLQEELLVSSPPLVEESRPVNNQPPSHNGSTIESSPTWQLAQVLMTSDQVLRLPVTGYNKGGLLVALQDLQGFVPASQLVDFPLLHVARERLRVLASLQGKALSLKLIEVDPGKNRLVFSERAAQVKAAERFDTLNRIKRGITIKGRVTNLTDFGAFVDLGGIEGLIHISELSWSRVTHPSHILQSGQEVRVLVLAVDHERERVALSYKRLKADPWETAEQRYKPDDIVIGIVSSIAHFGAFVLLEEELEGLIHVTEMPDSAILQPGSVVQEGNKVMARVLQVDGQKKRLALTLRNLPKSGPRSHNGAG